MNITRTALAQYLADSPSRQAVRRVAAYLVESRRSKELPLLLRDVAKKRATKGDMHVVVRTARPLDNQAKLSVEALVKQNYSAAAVEIVEEIDEQTIGGIIVETPDALIDLSVESKLQRLRRK